MNGDTPWTDRLAARWPTTVRRRVSVAGLAFGLSAWLVAAVIVGAWVALTWPDATGSAATSAAALGLPVAACIGALVSGAPLWWLVAERPGKPTSGRGGSVGAVVGVVAHPLMWLLFGVGWGAVALVLEGPVALLTAVFDGFGALLGGFLLVSVVGLLVTGIVTIPVAAVTGVALARLRRRAAEVDHGTDVRRPQDL